MCVYTQHRWEGEEEGSFQDHRCSQRPAGLQQPGHSPESPPAANCLLFWAACESLSPKVLSVQMLSSRQPYQAGPACVWSPVSPDIFSG